MKEYEFTGKAMGTDYALSIVCSDEDLAVRISEESIHEIEAYEKQFSRFLTDSELSRLNNTKNMLVSEEFIKVTKKARELYILTKGIFNPLVQIGRMGYDKDFSTLKGSTREESTNTYNIDFETTTLDEKAMKIILKEGQKLDFGGFLKGYLAEKICKKMMHSSPLVVGAIVNIGGDLHTQGVDAEGEFFTFDIYNPITEEEIPVTLHNQSLATSGTYKRVWARSDTQVHHILDSSGIRNPDTDIISSSVINTDGGTAEAYAKVFLSLGEKAHEILPENNTLFVLIKKDGSVIQNLQ